MPPTAPELLNSQHSRTALIGLYRRLRIAGETPQMLRRTATVYDLQSSVMMGRRLLSIHRELRENAAKKSALRMWNVPSKIKLGFRRRVLLVSLLRLRLRLRSYVAMVNLLSSLLVAAILFLTYQMYRACRVGLTRAEEKYATLAVPVLQSIEAMAAAEERRNLQRRAQMEEDVVRSKRAEPLSKKE